MENFTKFGYSLGYGGVYKNFSEIMIIIDPGVSKKNNIFSVSSGVIIKSIQYPQIKRFWHCHIYGNIGCIFPNISSNIGIKYEDNMYKIDTNIFQLSLISIDERSRFISNLDGLRSAYLSRQFISCMVTKDAKNALS